MNISSEPHQGTSGGVPSSSSMDGLGKDISRVSHTLLGSISALVMCEHMLSKELAPSQELASNDMLQTTLTLLKETVEQIREHGDELRRLSDGLKKASSNGVVAH